MDFFNQIKDFLLSKEIKYVFYAIMGILALVILYLIYRAIKDNLSLKKKYKRMLQTETETLSQKLNTKIPEAQAKKKTKNPIKKVAMEYQYYGGDPKKLLIIGLTGYAIFVVLLFLVSQSIGIAMILAFVWFTIFYVFIDNKNQKCRKKYIKGFASALRTLSSNIEAGNTFEQAIINVTKREGMNQKIKDEFQVLSNDIKNNKTREQAIEEFYQRNSDIPEFAMFAIVMQFFSKTGGAGLGKIIAELEDALNQKVMNYDKVSAELGVNQILMNILIYGYLLALLVINFFYTTFYSGIVDSGVLGYVKCFGSVFLHLISVYFYKNMIRKCAEGA